MTDHLGGLFTICGRISEFTAPLPATPGSLTVEGIVAFTSHDFVIDEAAAVDPLLAGLAATGAWTCLDLVGDGMGIVSSVATTTASTQCGVLEAAGQREGSTHEFTTVVLDGDAATLIGADPDLPALIGALVAAVGSTAEACLDFTFAADGTLAGVALDYAATPGGDDLAPIACGAVDGTAIDYRDPASQPYPEADVVSVDGFEVDATLVAAPFQEVLSFHLDAGLDLCLLVRVVDSVIVDSGVLTTTGGSICGELEVIGGLVFVDSVVVGQGLTSVNFAEPTPSTIASACSSASAQGGSASGALDICGDYQGAGDTTVSISSVTFHLEAPVDATDAPVEGGPQAVRISVTDPFQPFGAANPAVVTQGAVPGCPASLPDTSTAAPLGSQQPMAALVLLAILLLFVPAVRRISFTR
jgi:hypothetical protein